MTISKRTAQIMLIASVVVAALIYLIFESSLSESDMVSLSYIWLPIAVTGAAILRAGKNSPIFAIGWFIATALGLFLFFEVIFPML